MFIDVATFTTDPFAPTRRGIHPWQLNLRQVRPSDAGNAISISGVSVPETLLSYMATTDAIVYGECVRKYASETLQIPFCLRPTKMLIVQPFIPGRNVKLPTIDGVRITLMLVDAQIFSELHRDGKIVPKTDENAYTGGGMDTMYVTPEGYLMVRLASE